MEIWDDLARIWHNFVGISLTDRIQILLLSVVVVQLWITRRMFLADHERRRKQATFDYVTAVGHRYRNPLEEFDKVYGTKIVDISEYSPEDKITVRTYLNEIEYVCLGVNAKVFDYDILSKMMSTNLINCHRRFHQYIEAEQKQSKKYYIEFDEVVRRLDEDNKEEISNKGNIELS